MKTELNKEDRARIEQEAKKNMRKYYGTEANFLRDAEDSDYELKLFRDGAEYEHKYQREQQAIKGKEREAELWGEMDKADLLAGHITKLEAERSEVIRRIKSILKASTVHDKISILEELEQLLNSLKTK